MAHGSADYSTRLNIPLYVYQESTGAAVLEINAVGECTLTPLAGAIAGFTVRSLNMAPGFPFRVNSPGGQGVFLVDREGNTVILPDSVADYALRIQPASAVTNGYLVIRSSVGAVKLEVDPSGNLTVGGNCKIPAGQSFYADGNVKLLANVSAGIVYLSPGASGSIQAQGPMTVTGALTISGGLSAPLAVGQGGTGSATGAMTITSGFLVAPTAGGTSNGIKFGASANQISLYDDGAGNPYIDATGSNTDIDIRIRAKGAGLLRLMGSTFIIGDLARPLAIQKSTVAVAAPTAGFGLLRWEAGTNAGTLKLVAYAGTSTTGVTIVDNVGAGN